jgi:hypothetical protein
MVGKTGSSVPVRGSNFVTPHGREDWIKCLSGSNTPTCAYQQLIMVVIKSPRKSNLPVGS